MRSRHDINKEYINFSCTPRIIYHVPTHIWASGHHSHSCESTFYKMFPLFPSFFFLRYASFPFFSIKQQSERKKIKMVPIEKKENESRKTILKRHRLFLNICSARQKFNVRPSPHCHWNKGEEQQQQKNRGETKIHLFDEKMSRINFSHEQISLILESALKHFFAKEWVEKKVLGIKRGSE